jgi:vitamin K-dependent gamma-carboxylase
VPAHRMWSVDRWRLGWTDETVPAWTVNLVRFQVAVVYIFAGLAKISADWLLDAQPLRIWLAARSDLPVIGPFLADLWVAYAFSWFGAAYDLTIVFFLLWRRTRLLAYATVVIFHAMTAVLFPIGMFPWIMIGATLIFFPPDWPRRWAGTPARMVPAQIGGRVRFNVTAALLAIYAAIQIALPLRAYWPGTDPNWSGRGFNFAWRVMLVEKAGHTEFLATDGATGRQWPIRTREYVTERQEKMMAQDPFMIRALARHIAADLRQRGIAGVEVRADSFASLNGRALQRLIDPDVDLAASALPSEWIVPLKREPGPSAENHQE